MDQVDLLTETIRTVAINRGPGVVLAIITLIVGWWLIKALNRLIKRSLVASAVDESLRTFLTSLSSILLKTLLVISVAGMIGIEMTSFIAVLGAAGLAVGMALSGTLQNFAGGVMILLFRPFRVGDYIEAHGFSGTVSEIQIFATVLKTPDNKKVIVPNAPLSTGALVVYSSEPTRRVDLTFGIGYEDDIDQAKKVILKIIAADRRVLQEPEPFLAVSELAESSVNLVVRVWVNTPDYWGVHFDLLEQVKKTFDEEGISIPFPQQEVNFKGSVGNLNG